MVIRDLLDKNRKTRMYSFNITRDIPYMNIRFQFATDDSLVAAWKQLFRSWSRKRLSMNCLWSWSRPIWDLGIHSFSKGSVPSFILENPDLFMPKLVAADLASWNPFLLEWLGPEEYISDLDLFGPKWLSDLSSAQEGTPGTVSNDVRKGENEVVIIAHRRRATRYPPFGSYCKKWFPRMLRINRK